MLKTDERTILYFDAALDAYCRGLNGLSPVGARKIAMEIEKLFRANPPSVPYNNKKQTLYLSDYKYDGNYAMFLINSSDTTAVDPALSNPTSKQRREMTKKQGEGVDYSTHVIWRLDHEPNRPNQFLFLLEQIPGISSYRVGSYITKLINICAGANPRPFTIMHPDGTIDSDGEPKKIRLRHRLSLHGHPSDEFKDDLENGKLNEIELITTKFMSPWDAKSYTREKSRSVFLVPAEDRVLPKNWALISAAVTAGEKQYDSVRVKFKGLDGHNRSVRLDANTLGLAFDSKYVKKSILTDFKKSLKGSYEKFDIDIVDRILKLI